MGKEKRSFLSNINKITSTGKWQSSTGADRPSASQSRRTCSAARALNRTGGTCTPSTRSRRLKNKLKHFCNFFNYHFISTTPAAAFDAKYCMKFTRSVCFCCATSVSETPHGNPRRKVNFFVSLIFARSEAKVDSSENVWTLEQKRTKFQNLTKSNSTGHFQRRMLRIVAAGHGGEDGQHGLDWKWSI